MLGEASWSRQAIHEGLRKIDVLAKHSPVASGPALPTQLLHSCKNSMLVTISCPEPALKDTHTAANQPGEVTGLIRISATVAVVFAGLEYGSVAWPGRMAAQLAARTLS